jgi:hypothetical protein
MRSFLSGPLTTRAVAPRRRYILMRKTLHGDAEVDQTQHTSLHVCYVGTYVPMYEIVYLKVRQSMYKDTYIYIYGLRQPSIQYILQYIYIYIYIYDI